MKRPDVVRSRMLRQVLAGTPRVVCSACGEMFLRGSILFRLKIGQEHVACPKCRALDTLRDATPEEVAAVVPAPNEWSRTFAALLWVVACVGAAFVLYVLVIVRART